MLATAKNEVYKANSCSENKRVKRGVARNGSSCAKPVPRICDETFLENSDFENFDQIFENMNELRESVSDRSILRTIHFLNENRRVELQIIALKESNFKEFLKLVNESGDSSYKYLQNIYAINDINNQPLSIALALSEIFIIRKGEGACRVHGGGFAGTIQAFIKNSFANEYKEMMGSVFGKESIYSLNIRSTGSYKII